MNEGWAKATLLFTTGKLERIVIETLGEVLPGRECRRLLFGDLLLRVVREDEHILDRSEGGDELGFW